MQELDSTSGEFSFDFVEWVAYARDTDNVDFAGFIQSGTTRILSDADLAGYAAPFPSNEYITGVRIFPQLVANQVRQNTKVIGNFCTNWDKPLLGCAYAVLTGIHSGY
ncbi:hypothetical protein N9850_06215 [Granulosicoccus sp.]|nr:hypothetical protein [Granulosicoccus sp.]MDB4223348.1 hypothetical protein [Granulosicoccus sp.]